MKEVNHHSGSILFLFSFLYGCEFQYAVAFKDLYFFVSPQIKFVWVYKTGCSFHLMFVFVCVIAGYENSGHLVLFVVEVASIRFPVPCFFSFSTLLIAEDIWQSLPKFLTCKSKDITIILSCWQWWLFQECEFSIMLCICNNCHLIITPADVP